MNAKPDKLVPSLYGGIIMALLSTVPFLNLVNCLCCAGLLFGGFIAVYFYRSNFTPEAPPFTSGDCMAVGALAGVASAFFGTILSIVFLTLFGNVMGELILNIIRNTNLHMPEEAMDQIEEALQGKMSAFFIIVSFFQSLIVHSLFGLLGGLIGYSMFKPKGVPPPPMPQPPPASPAMPV